MMSRQATTNSPKSLRCDEIFVQDIGPAHVLLSQVDDRFGHQRIARRAAARNGWPDPRFDQPAQALGGFPAGLRAIDVVEQSGQFSRACHRRQGCGLVGRRPIRHHQRVVEELLSRHRHAAIGHRHRAVGIDGADELFGEPFRRHPLEFGLQQLVRRHLDIQFDDDSKQPVAAHRQREQFGVLAAGTLHQGPVRHHHADRFHGRAERPMRHRPAMGVDAERAPDPEIAVGLHHRRREALRIEHADDVPPAVARRRAVGHRGGVHLQRAAVERDGGAVARQALASHRVSRHRGCDRTLRGGCLLQFGADALDQVIPARL